MRIEQNQKARRASVRLWPRGLTVAGAAEEWLRRCGEHHKRSTCAAYRALVENHIINELGPLRVSEFTRERAAAYLRAKERSGLAPATVCGIITVLRAILRYAEGEGYVVTAWDALRRPRRNARETEVLTWEEQRRLEACLRAQPDRDKLGVLLCLYTGLRLGEVCALRWEDISPEGVLTVRRTVQRIRNPAAGQPGQSRTIVIFDAPKSAASRRSIPIPSGLLPLLEGFRCPPECAVLTGEAEKFREPRTMQNHFKAFLRQAGVRQVNFHALRHTFATNCVQLGFDPKTLSRILGHSTVGITLDTYVHPSISAMRGLMERLNAPFPDGE